VAAARPSQLTARSAGGCPLNLARKRRGRTIVGLLRVAWQEYERDFARYFASAMVFYALYSLVPLLLLVLSGLGLLLRFSRAAAAAEQQVLTTVAAGLGSDVQATIELLLGRLAQQSVVGAAVSLLGLVLAGSVLFRHLRLSFRAIWKHDPPLVSGSVLGVARALTLEYLASALIVLVGGLLLLMALALIAVTQWLSGLLAGMPGAGDTVTWLVALPISFALATLTFAVLLQSLPPVRLPWRHIWPAALVCAAAWTIAAEMLVLYGALFGSSQGVYGAIGGLLAVMLWMNLVSQVLFFGGELCKVVWRREGTTTTGSTADRQQSSSLVVRTTKGELVNAPAEGPEWPR
jgi:membrane protein